jgi:TP901 family phage tail tape measure protein
MAGQSLNIRVAFSAVDRFTRPVSAAQKGAAGMADAIKRTQTALKGLDKQASTFAQLSARANTTAQRLTKTQRALEGLKQAQAQQGSLTDAQRARLEKLTGTVSKLSASYQSQKAALMESAAALKRHGVTAQSGGTATESARRKTQDYNRTLEEQKRQLAALTQARSRYDRMQKAGQTMKSTGAGMMVGAAAAGYAGGRFLAPAVNFDAEMSRVGALTRIDKTDPQFAALREQAKKLGAETAFTTTDAASGQAFLAMAGFTPQSIRAALPGVLNMALAGGMELGESADIGSNVLSQFALSADKMDMVSDTLTAAFTRTNTDLRQLGETMVYAGPVASKLGISLQDAAAMAGALANNGMRGSMAGTALRASMARLASPTTKAAKALKELGVDVADSSGKMRPIQAILKDLYAASQKFGEVDQISFFKDIAGEEAFVGLQTLVESAGSGALGKLSAELSGAAGEAQAVARKMADNLGGDLKELDSAWEGLRIQIEETADGPFRKITQGLSEVINRFSAWVKANPRLAQTLLVVTVAVIGLTATIGALSFITGALLGPLAKLQLGFSLLTGSKGVSTATGLFRSLSATMTGSLGGVKGWGVVMTSLRGGLGSISSLAGGLGARLAAVFTSPRIALTGLIRIVTGLATAGFSGLASAATGAFSVVAGSVSFLLSPIGLLIAAVVGAGVLIWKYWEPLKAFFSGFFSGIWQQLAPLRDAFFTLSLVFDAIGTAVGKVWQWFKELFTPVESSRDSLNKCASAGETFGKVLGSALQFLMLPLTKLMEGIGWLLENLGLIPSGLEAARLKAESLKKDPVMWEWDSAQGKMVKKGWNWSAPGSAATSLQKPAVTTSPKLLTGDQGTQRRLQNIADNTGGLLSETKKRVGPGDIVFKNLPKALTVNGEWRESQVISQPLRPLSSPSARNAAAASGANGGYGDIKIEIHLDGAQAASPADMKNLVSEALTDALAKADRRRRSSFRDDN